MAMAEMLDVVDENGIPTGQKKLRTSVHRDGSWHRTVHVWIVNSRGDVLFQKRSMNKESFPGFWDVSAAGHVESGESSIEAAIKELHEELGVGAMARDLRFLFTMKNTSVQKGGKFVDNEISDVFLLRRDLDLSEIKPQESEVSGVIFFSSAELARIAERGDPACTPHFEEYRRLYEIILNPKK
jgi:isopentenyl-diphosphate delta-isomerase type 1